jgi:hypothetical protein
MAFLDNSGDIILDAVLTDVGRMRLARGDGSFQITAFALGDDEIDYSLFNSSHPSGSAYYDLSIKQTPILEAFTNNTSFLKSKLLSVNRNDLFYLPVIKLNELNTGNSKHTSGVFIVTSDLTTSQLSLQSNAGVLNGYAPQDTATFIRLDQGIDNSAIAPTIDLQPTLRETQYLLKMHNDLGFITSVTNNGSTSPATVNYIDDDGIASYFLSLTNNSNFVRQNTNNKVAVSTQTIAGPRGTILSFKIAASLNLRDSNNLFTELGGTTTVDGQSVRYIDSYIGVEGLTTGYKIEIPVRYIKSI